MESQEHKELKERARLWLESFGYFVREEVNIGNRVIDVLGVKPGLPTIGVECGYLTNREEPPEDINIFFLPYGSERPYYWKNRRGTVNCEVCGSPRKNLYYWQGSSTSFRLCRSCYRKAERWRADRKTGEVYLKLDKNFFELERRVKDLEKRRKLSYI